MLSDFQITIPELGTIRAEHVPFVLLTSNRSRELSDALRRRCLYLYIEMPGLEKELRILRSKVPGVSEHLARAVARFVQRLRGRELRKLPGIAESVEWAQALLRLHQERWVVFGLAVGFGGVTAVLWEFAEYFTFIRNNEDELRNAYEDTLGDLALGLSGSVLAAAITATLLWEFRGKRA